jgi:hypothetical protein
MYKQRQDAKKVHNANKAKAHAENHKMALAKHANKTEPKQESETPKATPNGADKSGTK